MDINTEFIFKLMSKAGNGTGDDSDLFCRENYIEDTNCHRILPGECYVTVQYLEKDEKSFSEVKYKLVKGYIRVQLFILDTFLRLLIKFLSNS